MNIKEPKREEPSIEFLGKKRNLDILQRNYLLRRFLSPVTENEYEKISNLYHLLMSFDWGDDKNSKNSIIQNLRSNSLWFYICSTYFPFLSNDLLEKRDTFPTAIRKFIIDPQAQAKNAVKKTSPNAKKERFIDDVMSLAKKDDVAIDELISSIEESLHIISKDNDDKMERQIQKEFILTDKPEINYGNVDDVRMDVEYHSKSLKKFLEYIKHQNEANAPIIPEEQEVDPDDVECVICNDGDYENDNLIVYCSLCHITVHQKCYGIIKVPEEDWICHSCTVYGSDNLLECVLCPVKGGAMKPCSLKKSSNYYSYIMTSRKENSLTSVIKSLEEGGGEVSVEAKEKRKNMFAVIAGNTSNPTQTTTNTGKVMDEMQGSLKKKKQKDKESDKEGIVHNESNKYINDRIANEQAWVHMSCALWIPEVTINNYDEKEEIKGVESIGKKRYSDSCVICLLKGYGPTIKCERCDLRFHVECARKNHYQLESTDNQLGENKFHIFCQRHAPHKLVKSRELRKQREIDDIVQFSNVLLRNIENYNRMHKNNPLTVCYRTKGLKKVEMNSKIKLNLIERKKFIDAIRGLAIQISSLTIKIARSIQCKDIDTSIEVKIDEAKVYNYTVKRDDKIKLTYVDLLTPSKFPWYNLRETQPYLKGLLPIEIFKIFKGIIPNEIEYARLILKKTIKKNTTAKGKAVSSLDNKKEVAYCYCHTNGEAPFMVECENREKCVNNGWYHQECVEELRSLSKEEIQSDTFIFICQECRKPNEEASSSSPPQLDNATIIISNNNSNTNNAISNISQSRDFLNFS